MIHKLLTSAVTRSLLPQLLPATITYEHQVDFLSHYYDFFYNLDTLLELVDGQLEGENQILNIDDLLHLGLQIYLTSFPSTVDAVTEGKEAYL